MSHGYTGPVAKKDARYARVINPQIDPGEDLYTDQSFAEECDINTIMAKYQSTGEMPVLNQMAPQYLDVTQEDFQTHMNFILDAQSLFDDLPSKIRERFGNDPGAFLGFCSDEENYPEMARMGLLSEEATTKYHPITNRPQPAPEPAGASTEPQS